MNCTPLVRDAAPRKEAPPPFDPDQLRQIVKAWASLDMVQHYAQMVGEDLFQSHKAHFPIDNF
jgi:hypothetical protein